MLGRPERDFPRPCHHLAHVEMDVLARLGQDRIDGPHRPIGGKHDDHGAAAALGIGQCIEQSAERCADVFGYDGIFHRCEHFKRVPLGQQTEEPSFPNAIFVAGAKITLAADVGSCVQAAASRSGPLWLIALNPFGFVKLSLPVFMGSSIPFDQS